MKNRVGMTFITSGIMTIMSLLFLSMLMANLISQETTQHSFVLTRTERLFDWYPFLFMCAGPIIFTATALLGVAIGVLAKNWRLCNTLLPLAFTGVIFTLPTIEFFAFVYPHIVWL